MTYPRANKIETFHLIIKGTERDAEAEAKRRNIKLQGLNQLDGECVAFTRAPYEAIAQWLNAPPALAPYPPGALLHFSFRDDAATAR